MRVVVVSLTLKAVSKAVLVIVMPLAADCSIMLAAAV